MSGPNFSFVLLRTPYALALQPAANISTLAWAAHGGAGNPSNRTGRPLRKHSRGRTNAFKHRRPIGDRDPARRRAHDVSLWRPAHLKRRITCSLRKGGWGQRNEADHGCRCEDSAFHLGLPSVVQLAL